MSLASTHEAGSQRQRTTLAWNRTAIALVGNGILVTVRHDRAFPAGVSVAIAGLTALTALLAVAHARRRRRLDVAQEPGAREPVVQDPVVRPATAVVTTLGVALTVLCALTLVTLAVLAV